MNISELNKRINIEVFNGESRDKEGYPKENWDDYHKCWAKRSYPGNKVVRRNEYFLNGTEWAENTRVFTVRKSSVMNPLLEDIKATKKYRIKYKEVIHDIKYIGENSRDTNFIDIICLCIS